MYGWGAEQEQEYYLNVSLFIIETNRSVEWHWFIYITWIRVYGWKVEQEQEYQLNISSLLSGLIEAWND